MPRLVDRDLQVEWRLSTDLFHRSYHTPGERLAAEAHRRIDALALGTRTATLISGSAERSLNIAYDATRRYWVQSVYIGSDFYRSCPTPSIRAACEHCSITATSVPVMATPVSG